MGGKKERAELAAFEALISRWIADGLWLNCEMKPRLTTWMY